MSGWTSKHSTTIAASPERLFAALTEPAQLLIWFAEHIEVEPRVGGSYAFHGRYTLFAGEPSEAKQRITAIDVPTSLGFDWPIADQLTTVVITLTADGESTKLELKHHWPRAPQSPTLVDDWWKLSLGNLQAHATGSYGIVRADLSDPSPEIRQSIVIDAPRERVWAALTDPAQLNQWIAAAAEVDAQIGGHYRYGWTYDYEDRKVIGGPTRILEIVPNQRLVTDWPDWRGDPEQPDTRVTWLLETVDGKTRVTLIHAGFPHGARFSDYPFGWQYFLQRLAKVFEIT